MFTGIVSERGFVGATIPTGGGARLTIDAAGASAALAVGDSVAINGVCLTAVSVEGRHFDVEAVRETLDSTNLGSLGTGMAVNLELPLSAGGRFDGHMVQGHVDGVVVVRSVAADGDSQRVWVDALPSLLRYVAEKGSVALDGISFTVSGVDDHGFEVVLIPHTLEVTTFGDLAAGRRLNLEVDVLAKYVERLLESRQ